MTIETSAPSCTNAREIAAILSPPEDARLERARAEAKARPIDYALGSGEADEVALYAGVKPLIRQVLASAELAPARARFEEAGFAVAEATHRTSLPSTEGHVLFVSADPRRAREAASYEAEPEHDRELGRLLGYPRCCVEAYVEIPPPRRNVDVFARALEASGDAFVPRLNTVDLAVFHYLSWLPCSFACALSKAFADAIAGLIVKRHGQALSSPAHKRSRAPRTACPPGCRHERFVAAIDEALSAHRLLLLEDVQISIAGAFDGERVHVTRAWPTARDRHAGALLGADALEASARLAALAESAGTIAIEDKLLRVGDAAILRTEDAMLFPFGSHANQREIEQKTRRHEGSENNN